MRVVAVVRCLTLPLVLAIPSVAHADCVGGMATTITQYGIDFVLEAEVRCGQFANGDYWVAPDDPQGTVTVTAITPDFAGGRNGWEVNPADLDAQGFDDRISSYDAGRVPALPYSAGGGESIVKAISLQPQNGDCSEDQTCLDTAAVLTVLPEPPPDDGSSVFRPPYFGDQKPLVPVADMQPDLLPTLAQVADTPTLDWVVSRYQRVQLDHKVGWTGRAMHPVQNMPDYGSTIGWTSGDAVLRLMLDDPSDAKLEALTHVVQHGIDHYYMLVGGVTWGPNGGHGNGRKLPIVFAGVLLGDTDITDAVAGPQPGTFSEDGSIWYSDVAQMVLWGQGCDEDGYWNLYRTGSGSRTCSDPYGYIDGGEEPGGTYQFCCNSNTWKGTGIALFVMPELRCVWQNEDFLDYLDRWATLGAHTQPDPCAPYDDNPDNYGIAYGPNGNGGCIEDRDPTCTPQELQAGAQDPCIGRFVAQHGTNINDGFHGSSFAHAMWDAYRAMVDTPPECVETGDTTGDDGGSTGDGGSTSSTTTTSGSDGGGTTSGTSGSEAGASDGGGCGCRAPNQRAPVVGAVLVLVAMWPRRRQRRSGMLGA